MASVLNRTTKQYILSAHTPDYPVVDWIINPDVSAVVGVPTKYWVITGDVVSEMSQAEKDAYDAAQPRKTFQFWEENIAETTAAETFQEKMARTAAPMNAGVYRLTWSFEMKVTATGPLNSQGVGRFLVDANVKSIVFHTLGNYVAYSGWDRYVATEGETPVLSLEIRRDPGLGGNDTIEIRKMKLGIEYMGSNG